MSKNGVQGHADEEQDRRLLKELYALNESYQETADDFFALRRVKLNKSMVRLLIKGYNPGKKIRAVLGWPKLVEVEPCPTCGTVHLRKTCPNRANGHRRQRIAISKVDAASAARSIVNNNSPEYVRELIERLEEIR